MIAMMATYELYGGPLDGRSITIDADLTMVWVLVPNDVQFDEAKCFREPPKPPYAIYQVGEPKPHKAKWIGTVHA